MEENHLSGSRDNRFVGVDTAFLEENLKKAAAIGKEAIVCYHTLETTSSTEENRAAAEQSVKDFYALLNKYNCRLILYGHSHVQLNISNGEQYTCNPGWFGVIKDYNYNVSPWGINVLQQKNGYFTVTAKTLGHTYTQWNSNEIAVRGPEGDGVVPASSVDHKMWKDNIGRADYKVL
jgi:hypothetical protein